jgi:hypothetical protein
MRRHLRNAHVYLRFPGKGKFPQKQRNDSPHVVFESTHELHPSYAIHSSGEMGFHQSPLNILYFLLCIRFLVFVTQLDPVNYYAICSHKFLIIFDRIIRNSLVDRFKPVIKRDIPFKSSYAYSRQVFPFCFDVFDPEFRTSPGFSNRMQESKIGDNLLG